MLRETDILKRRYTPVTIRPGAEFTSAALTCVLLLILIRQSDKMCSELRCIETGLLSV